MFCKSKASSNYRILMQHYCKNNLEIPLGITVRTCLSCSIPLEAQNRNAKDAGWYSYIVNSSHAVERCTRYDFDFHFENFKFRSFSSYPILKITYDISKIL